MPGTGRSYLALEHSRLTVASSNLSKVQFLIYGSIDSSIGLIMQSNDNVRSTEAKNQRVTLPQFEKV